jgi:hypothetical protein
MKLHDHVGVALTRRNLAEPWNTVAFAQLRFAESGLKRREVNARFIIDLDLVEGYFSLEPGAKKLSQRRNERVAARRSAANAVHA